MKNKFSWVNLTGGEVFLRDDLVEIVRSIQGTYLLNITTNGIKTSKIVRDCKEINDIIPKFILTVSVDGPEKIHNKIRGGNCWRNALETYKRLREIGIETYIGYTISPYNIDYLYKTIGEIQKIIPDFSIKEFHINTYYESEIYFANKNKIKENQEYIEKLKKIINDFIKKKKGFDPVSYLERKYLKLIEKHFGTKNCPLDCKALSSSCFIDPMGNVFPCTSFNINLGNIRENAVSYTHLTLPTN